MEQVKENLCFADHSRVGAFSEAEQALVAEAREKYRARQVIPCSKCGYCMPCPGGLNIPANFEYFNFAHLYDHVADARYKYKAFLTEAERSVSCLGCGICEEACPQRIAISEWMPKISELLA
jgi:hypothetical protein